MSKEVNDVDAKRKPHNPEVERLKEFDRKVKQFDRRTIEILVSALVSLLTSTFVLRCAGII